jgi:hypothetical protein
VSTYKENRKEAAEVMLVDSPLATFMLALARNRMSLSWTPQQLYEFIMKRADISKLGPRWPKTVSMFGSELRRIAPQLRLHGMSVNFERRDGNRVVTITSEGTATSPPPAGTPET